LTLSRKLNQSSSIFIILSIEIVFLCSVKSISFTSAKILSLNSGKFFFKILNQAACLCQPNFKKYFSYFSSIFTIEKNSGLLQLATNLSSSSFKTIDGR
jgi:hypothetical protein